MVVFNKDIQFYAKYKSSLLFFPGTFSKKKIQLITGIKQNCYLFLFCYIGNWNIFKLIYKFNFIYVDVNKNLMKY